MLTGICELVSEEDTALRWHEQFPSSFDDSLLMSLKLPRQMLHCKAACVDNKVLGLYEFSHFFSSLFALSSPWFVCTNWKK